MLNESLRMALGEAIGASSGRSFRVAHYAPVAGGCINQAARVSDGERQYFVKVNTRTHGAIFSAEVAGLRELATAHALRVPAPICSGAAQANAFLVLEWLDLAARPDPVRLGKGLALLHRQVGTSYGAHDDNMIGLTPQQNANSTDWAEFWIKRRLIPQFELAFALGYERLRPNSDKLLARVKDILNGHCPPPSLLHGDLWGGNVGGLADQEPVLFDPAVYYGDRETDLAMTELFGGFSSAFYAAYLESSPLPAGYERRKPLYNLYHLLNHLNLFGQAYLRQVEACLVHLLA